MKQVPGYEFIEIEYGTSLYQEMVKLRQEILRTPLGLQFIPYDLEKDKGDILLGILENNTLIACLIFTPLGANTYKMRQVAVAAKLQGTGVGKLLVKEAEELLHRRGASRIEMNARDRAVPFYEKLGYSIAGEQFEEVGIPHWFMFKNLQ